MKVKQTHGGGWGSWHQSPVYNPARTCDSQSRATHSIRALVSSRLLLTVRWRPNAPPTQGERTSLIFPPTLRSVSFERTGVDEGRIAGWSGLRRGGVGWGGGVVRAGDGENETQTKIDVKCRPMLALPSQSPSPSPPPDQHQKSLRCRLLLDRMQARAQKEDFYRHHGAC